MTLGTFHFWILLDQDISVSLSLLLTLSLFCGQSEVSIDAALLHKPLEPLTVCVRSIVSWCEMEQQVGQTLAEVLWEPTW